MRNKLIFTVLGLVLTALGLAGPLSAPAQADSSCTTMCQPDCSCNCVTCCHTARGLECAYLNCICPAPP